MKLVKYIPRLLYSFLIYLIILQQCFAHPVEGLQKSKDLTGNGLTKYSEINSNYNYLGCFDLWKTRVSSRTQVQYFPNMSLEDCAAYCVNEDNMIMLRGESCRCSDWYTEGFYRLDDEECYLTCGDSDLRCGSTNSISVYCNSSEISEEEGCKSHGLQKLTNSSQTLERSEGISSRFQEVHKFDIGSKTEQIEPTFPCYQCVGSAPECLPTFSTNYTYSPELTPVQCIEFCGNELQFDPGHGLEYEVRAKLEYASIGWVLKGLTSSRLYVPVCHCLNELPNHKDFDAEECNSKCPGDEEQNCGSMILPPKFTLYKAEITGGETTTDTNQDSSTTPSYESTTIIEETTLSSGSPTTESTTTNGESSESTADTNIPSRPTTVDGEGSTTSEAEQTTVFSIETTTEAATTTAIPCTNQCYGKDKFKINWSACFGTTAWQRCPRNADGNAYWKCSEVGEFIGWPDYSNCSSPWIETIIIGEDEVVSPSKGDFILRTIITKVTHANDPGKTGIEYFGNEISTITGIISKVLKQTDPNVNKMTFERLTEKAVAINENILANAAPWEELSEENRSSVGTELIQILESNMFELGSRSTQNSQVEYRKMFEPTNPGIRISAGGQTKSNTGNLGIRFPFDNELDDGSFIQLPAGWANVIPSENLNFMGMAISSNIVKPIFPEAKLGSESDSPDMTRFMNGKLMTFSVDLDNTISFPGEGVKIRFRHDLDASSSVNKNVRRKLHEGEIAKAVAGSAKCVYWDTSKLEWSSEGCLLVYSERSATLCECSHLTSFAVLMDRHNYVGKDFALELLTLIICPLSIICLFITIVVFTCVRSTHGARTTITKNLCISLLLGNLFILLVVDRNYFDLGDDVCTASAILVHYIFLTAFMWMAIQGYHLYRQIVHVFESGTSNMTIYSIIAYGVPFLYVGATTVVHYATNEEIYGGELFCWLQGDYIWTFLAPVLVICVANTVVLVITLKVAYQVRNPSALTLTRIRSSKIWIKGGISITALLGLTWLTGFLMMADSISSTIAAYIFTLLNASQGIFIFVFHCLLNEKVRQAAARRNIYLPSWLSSTATDASPTTTQGRREVSPSLKRNNTERKNAQKLKRRGSAGRPRQENGKEVVAVVSKSYDNHTTTSSLKSSSGTESSNGSKRNLVKLPPNPQSSWR